MELEQQVASLELCKKLKSLGVKQESLFWYLDMYDGSHHTLYYKQLTKVIDYYTAAFTVAELGEMLPAWFDSCKRDNSNNDWHVRVFEKDKNNVCHHSFDVTEANAKAKMLIYLIENNLWNPNNA